MKTLSSRLEKIEKEMQFKFYIPVLILDSEDDLKENLHLIGPNTVVFIDDIDAG
ncbi:hypothetical protein [Delftia tsuruhatensis]|uniref:hypothetical protein n=1 Tax=Bacteria TaxID=2 RepID=UPI000ABBCDCC